MSALSGLTAEQIEGYEAALLAGVPEEQPIGNVPLRQRLEREGWSDDLYWEIRNRLIDRGLLNKGRGQGGSVRRVPPVVQLAQVTTAPGTPALAAAGTNEQAAEFEAEKDLYKPMVDSINARWAKEKHLEAFVAEVTAAQGSRQTGGKWTRPDITAAGYKVFPYVPGRHHDVVTFEIKSKDSIDITVIYEALGHRRASTRAYALLHVPAKDRPALQAVLDEIEGEAKRHGVGLLIAEDPQDYDTWEEVVEATRHEPDPERLNDFLANQVSEGFREQFIKWFK